MPARLSKLSRSDIEVTIHLPQESCYRIQFFRLKYRLAEESAGVTSMKTEQKPLNSGFGAETTAKEIASRIDLRGKVCVITGGHSGNCGI
jgi:hypothetical protein